MDETDKRGKAVDSLALYFTEREMNEIEFAKVYEASFNHGTDGHNRLLLIAKLFEMLLESKMKEVK